MEVKPDEFIRIMQTKTEAAYLKSALFKEQGYNPYQPAYVISYTPIRQGMPLLLGFRNHDVSNKEGMTVPAVLERHATLFKRFLGPDFMEKINCSHFCFFQAAAHTAISEEDIRLCTPLFREYLRYIKPSAIFITDMKAYDAFREAFSSYREVRQVLVRRPARALSAYVGLIQEYTTEPVKVISMPLLESEGDTEELHKLFATSLNKPEETDSIPTEVERIFEAGIDGGVETYYRFRRRQADFLYFKKAIQLEFEEDGQERFYKKYYQLDSWEDCWQSFISAADAGSSWLSFFPVHIHGDYVPFIQAAILSEKHRIQPHFEVKEQQIQDWLYKIKEARYNEHR